MSGMVQQEMMVTYYWTYKHKLKALFSSWK